MAAYAGFMTHVICRLTAKNKTGISFGTIRWVIEYGLPLPIYIMSIRQTPLNHNVTQKISQHNTELLNNNGQQQFPNINDIPRNCLSHTFHLITA